MRITDLHVHTTYSDGKNTPRQMVEAALLKNMECIGFSDHSYTDFDESYCIKKDKQKDYYECILGLKEEYKGRIAISCGIEQDYYSGTPVYGFEHVIGSVHYLKCGSDFLPVDETEDILVNGVKKFFDGDFYLMAECYYEMVSQVVEKTNADIIGHFDLITKFNEKEKLFREDNPRYLASAYKAIDFLIDKKKPFEINTGAISRGYRTDAYPSKQLRDYIIKRGGSFILSSDSHSINTLGFGFEKYKDEYVGTDPYAVMGTDP